jgi:ATP-dependent exoDNAse (exonuclease V) alpha subunit
MNYCCTTHKMQGETLTENFTIYDWNKMDTILEYTALSRAKKPDQVYNL